MAVAGRRRAANNGKSPEELSAKSLIVMNLLIAPQNWVFAFSLGLAVLFCLLQLVAGIGDLGMDQVDVPGDGDGGIHLHDGGLLHGLTDWLHLGRLPMTLALTLFGICFGLAGLGLQYVLLLTGKSMLAAPVAIPLALLLSLPIFRIGGAIVARLLPRDETEAVSADSFAGREARITTGTARRGYPAEARLHDAYGKAHYVMVEPEDDDAVFAPGTPILLLTRHGHFFRAIDNSSAASALDDI